MIIVQFNNHYFESMNLLNEIISKDLTSENIVKAKYILSELYINDFNDYNNVEMICFYRCVYTKCTKEVVF